MMTLINKIYYPLYRKIYGYPCKSEIMDILMEITRESISKNDYFYISEHFRTGKHIDFIKLFYEMYLFGFFLKEDDVKWKNHPRIIITG